MKFDDAQPKIHVNHIVACVYCDGRARFSNLHTR